ncbi:hypothetical protein [Brevibacillus nitrificans]|uniref:hypothetical protein n=1 Tax=Brevibacillus nitrificans TaxID=651560 RepID=UPI00285A4F7A|nr:hypothetical protein [Brevibacillus nitrificans]MDR7316213.1 hypothetical protein [Brevibacillus nitrificans]
MKELSMLALFTLVLDSTGAGIGFVILACLLVFAALGVTVSMPALLKSSNRKH